MQKDTQSIAPSEATTLVDDGKLQEQRTTLTGKPIEYEHDHFSGMMLGDGGGFGTTSAGANLLPPGYTDKSLVRIPIKMSDVHGTEDTSHGTDIKVEKKGGLFGRFSSKRREANNDIKVVMMSRGDYLKYWAKDDKGNFLDSVVEPPEGRAEWLRQQLELNDQMMREDPSLGKPRSSSSSKSKSATVIAAMTAT